MLEIAIVLIVGFGLGYGVREWGPAAAARPSIHPVCADGAKQRDGDVPVGDRLRVAIWQSTCIVAASSVAGANITNHRIAAHSETTPGVRNAERCFFIDSYLRQRGPFPELGS